ncbi:MAG: serine dehydratase subunit alpha family protein [Paludibacteraceae bacterium]
MDLLQLLHQEVVPAIGCTEPMAVALCIAKAKERLGGEPASIYVALSKNIYKNALAVGIPNTDMTGLPIAIALGATIGKSQYQLEVLRDVTPKAVEYAKQYIERTPITIEMDMHAPDILYIHAEVRRRFDSIEHTATATIQGSHTHFVDKDSVHTSSLDTQLTYTNNSLKLLDVYHFATTTPLNDVRWLLDGAKMNIRAAEQSFEGNYGHGLGRLLHRDNISASSPIETIFGDTLFTKILSYTSGACDARMAGAMMPIMSNSGSGNQGISCSIPVYLYATEHQCSEEQTLRALTLSNLTVIYIKQSLGRLSALCGCVVAATGSAAGITYLMGGGYTEITYAIKNMIANISGMICDGAKPGCALKVTSGVATAILSASLAMQHSFADSTEGIVEDDIDRTIHNLTRIGRDGMTQTDDLILDIMTHKHIR